ncbi:MAG: copper-translocating P-type ATPase [Sphingobacteriia bacterium]|nr:copper-translocating P-type ATPase [Sphingobacteriia bacterium]
MHPEIRQMGPGNCPKCGMSLEPETMTNELPDDELILMTKRLIVCIIFSLPLTLVAMGGHLISISNKLSALLQLIFSTPVVLWGAWPFFTRFVQSITNRNLNMFTLLGLGIGVSYLYSLVVTLFGDRFTSLNHQNVYFEAAGVITTLALLGQFLELKARKYNSKAIQELFKLVPKTAKIIEEDNTESEVALEDIKVGNLIKIHPGEKIPVDGIVTAGESLIDESMLTGEFMPVSKALNDKVIGGTLNTNGSLIIKALHVGKSTILSQIIEMVSKAQRSKAPIQKIADIASSYLVSIIILIAIITYCGWYIFGPEPKLTFSLLNSIAVLIIACPCALGLATPMSIIAATSQGAKAGIIIKDAATLEMMGKIDTIVMDKTGTLTEGKPKITLVKSLGNFSEDQLIYYAGTIEQSSEHPLAKAIINKAKDNGINLGEVENFKAIIGQGVRGQVDDLSISFGNLKLFDPNLNNFSSLEEMLKSIQDIGQTTMYLGINDKIEGILVATDQIKTSSFKLIHDLKNLSINIIMLTGDEHNAALKIATQLGITEIFANVSPKDKSNVIRELQIKGKKVVMVGDGINDAVALAQADVGISMGTGTDVAIESASITLLKGDMSGVLKAYKLSKATILNIKQNLFFAFIYNFLGVPVAAGLLYPWFGILLSPIIASLAMAFSSVSVILNAIRLKRVEL